MAAHDAPQSSSRLFQILFVAATLFLSWLLMMAVHEFGHVLHAWFSGGKVERVVLHPLAFSRTDLAANPDPLFVVWGGPIWGCLLPLVACCVARFKRLAIAPLLQFFAGFCLIANGVYLGAGSFAAVGDAFDLLNLGVPRWALVAFGVATVAPGLFLWNGLGGYFGFGAGRESFDRRTAAGVFVLLALVLAIELIAAHFL